MKRFISKLWNAFDGLAADSLWAATNDVTRIIFALISFTALQRVLTTEEYGAYIAVFAISAPLGSLTYSGPSLAALTAMLREKQPAEKTLRSYLSTSLVIGLVSLVFGVSLALLISSKLGFFEIFFILSTELIAGATIFICSAIVQANSGYAAMTRLRLGLLLIRLLVLSSLVVLDERLAARFGFLESVPIGVERFESLTILNLSIGYFIGYICYSIFLMGRLMRSLGFVFKFTRNIKEAFMSSLTFAIPMTASRVQTDGDKVVLGSFEALEADTGLYGAAYKVVSLGMAPIRALDSAAFQRFLPDNDDDRSLHIRRSVKFTAVMFSVSVVVATIVYLTLPFVDFLFDDDFIEAREIVPWLLPFIPLLALSGTPMNGLIGLGRAKERSYIYVASAAVSLVLYLILIPAWGWRGAVAGTLASETILAIVSWVAILHYQRKRNIEFKERENV